MTSICNYENHFTKNEKGFFQFTVILVFFLSFLFFSNRIVIVFFFLSLKIPLKHEGITFFRNDHCSVLLLLDLFKCL